MPALVTRHEKVVLSLEDRFSTQMARAAASAALLNRELDSLSKDSIRTQRSFSDIDRGTVTMGRNANKTGAQIDRLSGRMRILGDVAAVLGPSLIPIGAIGIPAMSGLAAQFGFAATGAGVALLAFQGVGDAISTMNKAALEPTSANMDKARIALEQLSPAAQGFVKQIGDMRPALRGLRDAEGLFPGLTQGLDSLEAALPRVQGIISAVATEMGSIGADVGASLASDRWAPFLDFIAAEAPEALRDMADAAGSTIHAMANLWIAFEPLNDDFSKWLVDATDSLDEWSAGLSQTQGFQDFVAYIRETGPQVADTFAAIGGALLDVVEAAAPLGGPVLQGIEAVAKAVSAIADSDLGTPLFTAVAALALFNRTMAITTASRNGIASFGTRLSGASAQTKTFGANLKTVRADLALMGNTALTAGARTQRELARSSAAAGRLRANLVPIGKGAALLGGLGIAATGAADSIGLTNTASLALAGSIGGGPGVLAGGLVGALIDGKAASDNFADALKNTDDVIATHNLDALIAKLDQLKAARDDASNVTGFGDFFGDLSTQIRSNPLPTPGDSGSDDPISKLEAQIENVKRAMSGASSTAGEAAEVTDVYGNVIAGVGATADTTAGKIDALVTAMEAQRQEALAAFDAQTRYRQALKEARKQAAESDAGIKGNTKEALKNRDTISTLAKAWNDQSDAVKNNQARFRNAKANFIETATAMGVPIEQAKRLAKRLLDIPEKKVIGVEFQSVNALNAIEKIKKRLHEIPKRLRTDYFVNQVNTFNKNNQGGGIDGNPDTPWASGGWTGPGSKYQAAGVVHADEFVFSKEATHGNVAYLEALHRQMRGYADGGLVRRASSSPNVSVSVASPANIDYERLAKAVAAVRPLAGVINVSGDGSFGREHKRLEALDGIGR